MDLFKRSVYCGEVNESHLDKEIFLAGWVRNRRDHGGLIFIDLYDRSGLMQLVFNPDINKESHENAHSLRSEYVISVRGTVIRRSDESINPKMATGEFELVVKQLSIVNKSQPLPFQLEEADKVDEELRLKYRYIDLRRAPMQSILKLRHDVNRTIRDRLNIHDFYEVETPVFSKSTPEGARDFLVPSRLHPGTFYALPQSPQIYKQLLMASGLDKYYQIARCFRDEDFRANRQPEFTQLDIEMSFVQEQDVQNICEDILQAVWHAVFNKELSLPLPRMTYDEAISRYGSDKPDTRFALEINDITPLFAHTELGFLKATLDKGGKAGCLVVKDHTFTRSELQNWVDTAMTDMGAKGLLYIRFNEDGSADSPVSKFLPDDCFVQLRELIPTITTKDTLLIVADRYDNAWHILGRLRMALGKSLNLIDEKAHNLLWITDFPMFEWGEQEKRWFAKHHPFTQPKKGWEGLEPKDIRAKAYDIVYNGEELGGGSIRIHDADEQEKIFELLGMSKEEAYDQFGFLLDAQKRGYPPHGGIALGIDRLIMLLANVSSIRDVIAFPKTQSGACPLFESPSAVDKKQLTELHLKSTYQPK